MAKNPTLTLVVTDVTFVFPHVFTASAPKLKTGTAEPRFKTLFLVPQAESARLDELRKTIVQAIRAEFPDAADEEIRKAVTETVQKGENFNAVRTRKGGKEIEEANGKFVLAASSKFNPGVWAANGQRLIDPNSFYGGCKGHIEVGINPYRDSKTGELLCSLYLNHVLKAEDGPKIGGGMRSAADVFGDVIGGTSTEDPMGEAQKYW